MVLSSKLRVTENIKNRMDEVVKAIKRGAACPYVYCITLPSCKQNLLDERERNFRRYSGGIK